MRGEEFSPIKYEFTIPLLMYCGEEEERSRRICRALMELDSSPPLLEF